MAQSAEGWQDRRHADSQLYSEPFPVQLAVPQSVGAHGLLRSGADLKYRSKLIIVQYSTVEYIISAATCEVSFQRAHTKGTAVCAYLRAGELAVP